MKKFTVSPHQGQEIPNPPTETILGKLDHIEAGVTGCLTLVNDLAIRLSPVSRGDLTSVQEVRTDKSSVKQSPISDRIDYISAYLMELRRVLCAIDDTLDLP